MKDGDKYINISSGVEFILKQETPVTWSLRNEKFFNAKDYPIRKESHIISLLEQNFRKVEDNE